MPLIPPQTDPVEPRTEPEVGPGVPRTPPPPRSTLPPAKADEVPAPPADDTPVTFVPHDKSGALATPPALIPAGRYGVLEAHELVRLLSSMDDERARSRFRESVYLSVFFWILVVLVILYGPHYLWHAPKLILPSDVLKQRELTQLNAPILRHAVPAPRPSPKPALDNHTLEKLREMTKRAPVPTPAPTPTPAPAPVTPTPAPTVSQPTPRLPLPSHAPPVVDAPLPQPTAKQQPNFSNPGANMGNLAAVPRGGGASGGDIATPRGANVGGGMEILSDTQGVDFSAYLRRMHRDTMNAWLPLLPEETEAPLLKSGQTNIIVTILPDGTIGDMRLESSTRDMAIDKAAWGSIVSQGKLQPLPSQFHGPNLVLRLMYSINERGR